MTMSSYQFMLSDKLPWTSDAAISIFSHASNPGTNKMKKVITAYSKSLVVIWQKSFSPENTISRSHIEKKLVALVKDFYNKVYMRVHRKSAKKKGTAPKNVSMRVAIAEWRRENDKLLDIGRRMETVTGRDRTFYLDQQTNRECRLSEEIDDIFEMNEEIIRLEAAENKEREVAEELYAIGEDSQMFDLDGGESSGQIVGQETVSLNRSGLACQTSPSQDIGVQTDLSCPDRPKLRVVKKQATQEIKSTCATVSAVCGLSTENARKCVKIVAKNLYGHDFYLTPSAQLEGECGIIDDTLTNHVPVKAADYENYT